VGFIAPTTMRTVHGSHINWFLAIEDLMPEALHAISKTVALLLALSECMRAALVPPVDVEAALTAQHGFYKPQTGVTVRHPGENAPRMHKSFIVYTRGNV
jgi:hypothetical protein